MVPAAWLRAQGTGVRTCPRTVILAAAGLASQTMLESMTLVLAWPNRELNATTVHLASDSLLSDDRGNQWRYGPKIVRVDRLHEFMAYSGTSNLAMSLILQSNAVLSSTDVLRKGGSSRNPTLDGRVRALILLLEQAVSTFPTAWLAKGETTLVYCGFDHRLRQFRLFEIYLRRSGIKVESGSLSNKRLLCYGSGAEKAKQLIAELGYGNRSLTKVEILTVLKQVIEDRSVPDVGGSPQLVEIGKRSSQVFGFSWGNLDHPQRTLFGMPLHFRSNLKRVRFLDRKFHLVR